MILPHDQSIADKKLKKENISVTYNRIQTKISNSRQADCYFAGVVVATFWDVEILSLIRSKLKKTRGTQARRVAMYLAHTKLSVTLDEIASFFSRHKSTVSQACTIIEDLRDNRRFDKELEKMEQIIDAAITARLLPVTNYYNYR